MGRCSQTKRDGLATLVFPWDESIRHKEEDTARLIREGKHEEALEAYKSQGREYLRKHRRAEHLPPDLEQKIKAVETM